MGGARTPEKEIIRYRPPLEVRDVVFLRKLDSVVSDLEARGLKFRLSTSLRVGYVADILFKKEKIIVLDTRNADPFTERKLAAAGYRVFVIPVGKLSDEEVKGFCDEVEKEVRR